MVNKVIIKSWFYYFKCTLWSLWFDWESVGRWCLQHRIVVQAKTSNLKSIKTCCSSINWISTITFEVVDEILVFGIHYIWYNNFPLSWKCRSLFIDECQRIECIRCLFCPIIDAVCNLKSFVLIDHKQIFIIWSSLHESLEYAVIGSASFFIVSVVTNYFPRHCLRPSWVTIKQTLNTNVGNLV